MDNQEVENPPEEHPWHVTNALTLAASTEDVCFGDALAGVLVVVLCQPPFFVL